MNKCFTFMTQCYRLFVLVMVFVTGFAAANCQAKDSYTFGIVPQQSASALVRTWAPILNYLEKHSGVKIQFETAKNIPTFEENLAKGKYDFAYMNPYHYVMFHRHSGYKAIAKSKDTRIHGIIVVHKDSQLKSIKDLNNKELVFPSPLAFAASLIPRSELRRQMINVTPRYVSSHDSVYRNVADKNFVAGGGVVRTFNTTPEDVRARLRILYTTDGYTPHAFAVHPTVPDTVLKAVRQAMLDMEKTTEGKVLLESLDMKGIASAKDTDWDDVRKVSY